MFLFVYPVSLSTSLGFLSRHRLNSVSTETSGHPSLPEKFITTTLLLDGPVWYTFLFEVHRCSLDLHFPFDISKLFYDVSICYYYVSIFRNSFIMLTKTLESHPSTKNFDHMIRISFSDYLNRYKVNSFYLLLHLL